MFIIVVSGIRNSYVAVVMAPLLLNGSVCNVFLGGGGQIARVAFLRAGVLSPNHTAPPDATKLSSFIASVL